jgi:hypothetical protein
MRNRLRNGSSHTIALAFAVVSLAGCAARSPQVLGSAPELTTDARVEVGRVHAASGAIGNVDAAGLLRTALEKQLERRAILWSAGGSGERVVLDCEILDYEPGNAFKRWLIPGYGATVLAVRGRLTNARDGSAAGAFEHSRGVYAGGAYTIGAWRRIFDSVASDIARDLDIRIHRRGFTVTLAPWSSHDVTVPVAADRRAFASVEGHDLRTDRGRIGTREAAFGVSMGDVFFGRDVDDFMAEAVRDQLRAAGHRIEQGAGPIVTVDVRKFWVHTETTALYWDVIGQIGIDLRVGDAAPRSLDCLAKERTYAWPSEKLVGEVMDECLGDLMSKLVSEPLPAGTASASPKRLGAFGIVRHTGPSDVPDAPPTPLT